METILTRITDYLLTQSWQIAVLVVAVAAVNLTLRNRSAHVRYLIWLIVLAKCLMPPLLTVPLAILPQAESVEPVPISPPTEIPAVDSKVAGATIAEPVELPSVTLSPEGLTVDAETLEPGVPLSSPAASEKVDLPRIDVKPAEAPKVSAAPLQHQQESTSYNGWGLLGWQELVSI